MLYAVVTETNTWNRHGGVSNLHAAIVAEFDDLYRALAACRRLGGLVGPHTYAAQASRHWVADEHGRPVDLFELYSQRVGKATVDRQLVDDSFSINLDRWFDNLLDG